MKWLRTVLVIVLAIGLSGAALPAFAQGIKETKGVLEKVEVADQHVVIRETHGRKGLMPLAVAKEVKITTVAGPASLTGLHVGDEVTVKYGSGPRGEEAKEIQVTKVAPAR
jgi:hypothetical protein